MKRSKKPTRWLLTLDTEHQDHVRGADCLARRHGVPIYGTAGTLRHAKLSDAAMDLTTTIRSGEPFEITRRGGSDDGSDRDDERNGFFAATGFRVEAFRLPHDAHEPVGFVVEDGSGRRLGLVSDLGSRSRLAWGRLRDLDALVIETNHDLSLLRNGPYPWHLKQRVASRKGHLSNLEAARGVAELLDDRLRHVVLYHLSRTNNRPELATEAIAETLQRHGSKAELVLTCQDEITPWIAVERSGQLSLWESLLQC